jgi:hypothetical protein
MNKDVPAKVGSSCQARGKQFAIADRPERVTQEFFGYAVHWRRAGIADGDVGVAGMQVENVVGADHVERRIGTRLSPAGQAGHEPSARKCICGRNAKRLFVAIVPDGCDRNGKRFEAVANDREEAGSGLG